MADVFCEEYASSLNDLTCNSKPHISVLTMLAEENSQYAPNVVRLIEQHLQKVRPEIKLPAIYLIDSIVKNVRGDYLSLFTQNLVSTFCSVFEKVDEKTRLQLYKLRQTWVEVFPNKKLYAIDVRVHQMDPAWPISAPTANQSIHVNPKFLKSPKEEEPTSVKANQEMEEAEMRRQLIAKQQELLKLQQQKLELELLQAKNRLEEQKRILQTQQTEVEITVQETNKLLEVNKPVANAAIIIPQVPAVTANSVITKDPRSAKGPRPIKEPKPFRIPNLSSAVMKPVNNAVAVAAKVEGQIKSEVKQIASGARNVCDMAAGTFFAKQTLAGKEHGARNDVAKAIKKKDSELPVKVSSKKKTEREWKKSKNEANELKKVADAPSPSPNKKSPDAKKRKEKSKKDSRDASKVRKGERKLNAKKKEHEPNKMAEGAGRRTNFRSRRNYRSNRDRSESPEPNPKADQLAACSPKSDGAAKDGKYKKKLGDVVVVVDESKDNKMDSGEVLIADVDLRKVKRDVVNNNNNDDGNANAIGTGTEEPPSKRIRRDDDKDTRITNLFGSKDQDYRQMSQNDKNFLRNDRNSWAQYKAEHPDEFKNAPFPARGNRPDFVPYRSYDMDLRMPRDFDPDCAQSDGGPLNAPPGMRGARGRSNDPRLVRRGFGRPARQANNNNNNSRVFEDRNLRRHPLYQRYQMEFENSHPSEEIPNALQLDKQGEIMRQADQQLKCGLLTREQHHELLNQLAKLYELQVTRQRQREEQLRERIMSNRPSVDEPFAAPETTGVAVTTAATTTTTTPTPPANQEPETEPEAGARTKVSMLSIFQRENAGVAAADAANPNRTAVAADDGDRLIAIDGKIMKLKYHDGTAIILEGSKVQEILFRGTRREIFVDREIVLLGFEGDEQTFYLNSKPHTLKFGTPTHEIYVDKVAYEARFGGPPIRLMLDGEVHEIRMGGPPPDVELKELGADMKAQIAHLIDDPKSVVAGAKEGAEQKTLDERSKEDHQQVPMDIDELNEGEGSIVTNVAVEEPKAEKEPEAAAAAVAAIEPADVAARVSPHEGRSERPWDKDREQFASSSFKGRDKWREREKPARNVREYNTARQMDERDDYWPRRDDEFVRRPKYYNNNNNSNSNSGGNNNNSNNNNNNNNNRERGGRNGSPQRGMGEYGRFRDGPRRNFNPMYFAEGPRMRYDGARAPYDNRPRGYDGHPRFEMRPRADPRHTGMRQPLLGQYYGGTNQFNLDQSFRAKNCDASNVSAQSLPFGGPAQTSAAATVPAPSLDMSELFQKLVANGIIPSTVPAEPSQETNKMDGALPDESEQLAEEEYFEEYDEKLPLIEFTSECLRTRYPAIIGKLCRGIQCSSCGLRFTSEQAEKYAQHLDWHFRQNRRERDSAKKAMSRKWYYDVQDWIQFEEIEDMEERARSLFEEQATEDQTEQTEDVQTIPVAENDDDNVCAVCGESFEQFWDEDKEEWHLRDATRIDGKTYHPICYEDIRNISQADISAAEVKEEPKQMADSWKSLEENESKLKRAMKEEKENVAVAVAVADADVVVDAVTQVKIKEEPVEPEFEFEFELARGDAEAEAEAVVSDGKASVDIGQDEEEKELCIKEELIDNRMESISSHLIDDNVELDVKLNEDKRNVDENLVCPVKTEEVVESLAPTCRPVESQDDGMVEYVPPKLPGFTILPPAMKGTELSGLCSVM